MNICVILFLVNLIKLLQWYDVDLILTRVATCLWLSSIHLKSSLHKGKHSSIRWWDIGWCISSTISVGEDTKIITFHVDQLPCFLASVVMETPAGKLRPNFSNMYWPKYSQTEYLLQQNDNQNLRFELQDLVWKCFDLYIEHFRVWKFFFTKWNIFLFIRSI